MKKAGIPYLVKKTSVFEVLESLPDLRQIRIGRKRFLMINNKLLEEKKC